MGDGCIGLSGGIADPHKRRGSWGAGPATIAREGLSDPWPKERSGLRLTREALGGRDSGPAYSALAAPCRERMEAVSSVSGVTLVDGQEVAG